MIRYETTVEIAAPAAVIWGIMVDVEKWPEWTPSITSVQSVGSGDFGMGSEAKVAVRSMGISVSSVWKVTQFEDGRSFTWESSARGVRSVAAHVIDAGAESCRVTLWVELSGMMVTLLGPMFSYVSRRNVDREAAGLKARAEAAAAAAP
jgi:carbon monoxide dehydrogenase subunit G